MKTKNNILTSPTLRALILLLMVGWGSSVLAETKSVTAKWNFETSSFPSSEISGKVATLAANEGESIEMTVDAKKGKLKGDSKQRAQFNVGTVLRIPVVSTKDVVEVKTTKPTDKNRPSKYCVIGGVPASAEVTTYRAKTADVNQGYVEIEAIKPDGYNASNTYLFYISLTQYPPVYETKCIYSTNFQDWKDMSASDKEKEVNEDQYGVPFQTVDGKPLSFYLTQTSVDNDGTQEKFDYTTSVMTAGWMRGEKKDNAVVRTSMLDNVTKVEFVQACTAGANKAGWGLRVIDGDGNVETIYNTLASNTRGEKVSVDVNRNHVQLEFYNIASGNYAFMTSLDIYGNVEVKEDVTITYYDVDGATVLGKETINASNPLTINKEMEEKVTQGMGEKFRGWFDGMGQTATKIVDGTELSVDLSLYAKVTPIETADDGTDYTYDMTKNNWYPEDHDLIIGIDGGAWQGVQHGWTFSQGGTIKLKVAKTAHLDFTTCSSSGEGLITVTDAGDKPWGSFNAKASADGTVQGVDYKGGESTVLTINMPAGSYLHSLRLMNYAPVYVYFDFKGLNIQGTTTIDPILCESLTGKATLPDNTLFYRDGWSFMGWTDGTSLYDAGEEHAFNQSVTLKPKMVVNNIDLTDTNSPLTVVWPFDYRKAPVFDSGKWPNKTCAYTKRIDIEQQKHDVTLKMDVTNGKIDNIASEIIGFSNNAEGAQFNDGTKFTLPAVYGMTVTVHASIKVDDRNKATSYYTEFGTNSDEAKLTITDANNYTLETKDAEISDDKKTITFVYQGNAKDINLIVTQAGNISGKYGFYNDITVVYPVFPNVDCKNDISNADADTFPYEKAENAGKVTVALKSEATTQRDNTGSRYRVGDVVTITAASDYGYDFKEFLVNGTANTASTFDYTITGVNNTVVAVFERKTLHKVVVKSADLTLGNVTLSPVVENFYHETIEDDKVTQLECWYVEGEPVKLTADAVANYMLDYWSDGSAKLSENNPYTYTVGTENCNIFAHFTLGNVGSVVFKIADGLVNGASDEFMGAESMVPESLVNVRSFAIPSNYTFFRHKDEKGSTLQYWVEEGGDASNYYEPGQLYSFKKPNERLVLVPYFGDNPASYVNRRNDAVIRYDFGRSVHEYVDPTLNNQRRKVCAQTVNIGSGEKTFWTAQAYVEVLEEGEEKSHRRDVALYCDTGKKGYIRNNNLDNWCAFGPGTTFWVPSGVGATISLLTYSPITTTTFDGAVPTLDEKRTAEEREKAGSDKIYVYTHTTQSTESRVPVVIGDDYSYYQWMELSVLKANMVNLHVQSANDACGVLTKVESASGHSFNELEDGGHAFLQGDRVRLSFQRKKGFELDKIVDPDKTDKQGNPLAVLKVNDDGTVNMVGLNNVSTTSPVSKNDDGTWGVASGDNKTVFVLSKKDADTYAVDDSLRTNYEVEFDITTNRTLQIVFKEKTTHYITYNAGNFAVGTPPEATWVEAGDQFVIPRNQTLYYEGNTLAHWEDDEKNVYEIGKTYTAKNIDMRLFPLFNVNDFNLLTLPAKATATWNFTKNENAPTINYERTKGILVTQLTSGDKSIDLKIELDGTQGGKFNNVDASRPERIQINKGSVIVFPATPQCVAVLKAVSEKGKKIKIENQEVAVVNDKDNRLVASAECIAETAEIKATFIDGIYSQNFSVTYLPQSAAKATIQTLTCDGTTLDAAEIARQMATSDFVSFTVSPWNNADESIPTVEGTATENGTVTVTKATVLTRECLATVKTKAGITVETYPIHFNFTAPDTPPKFVKVVVNGVEYTSPENVINDVPRSGLIQVVFDRTMDETTIQDASGKYEAMVGKTLDFKYWDQPAGSKLEYLITPEQNIFKDIYGMTCQQTLKLTLNITEGTDRYHHHPFDFVVGKDGTIDEAIAAANGNTKENNHRYFIFVPDGVYQLTGNTTLANGVVASDEKGASVSMGGKNNGLTKIAKPNISIIGQSKDGTIVYNHPVVEGISYTATILADGAATDFYAQDLTLENRFNYWGAMSGQASGGAGRAVAFQDKSKRSILKKVALKSWQDTYYSNNQSSDSRGYLENSDLYGVVDWICGDGNIWFEKCNIVIRDRSGNNIAAPSTSPGQDWGYVFNNCVIKPETETPTLFKGKDWTLARPWGDSNDQVPASPACTFLNTTMYTEPRSYGWNRMGTNLVIRFHEYRSKDGNNIPLSLGTRTLASCSPAPGSDDCILNETLAQNYNLRNVLGGPDAFEPDSLCRQIDAASAVEGRDVNSETWEDDILVDDDILQWNAYEPALCYFLFKRDETTGKWVYQANTTDNSIALMNYGSGYYCVRAANQRGGLGAATKTVRYMLSDPYELDLKQTGDLTVDGVAYGWSTICLPFNARVPEEVTVYAATAHGKQTAEDKVLDYTMTLTPVNVMESEKGYIVYGPVGIHAFRPTSRQSDPEKPTILVGNPTKDPISSVNNNGYVLANKTWGLGFYKYSGSTLAPYRAWLPKDMVGENVQLGLSAGTNAIRFNFSDGSTPVQGLHYQVTTRPAAVYNLKGEQVDTPSLPGVYIIQGKGKVLKK